MQRAVPCWILSYPRTGSSFLASSLNFTGLYDPICIEWLNPAVDKRDTEIAHQTVQWKPWHNIPPDIIKDNITLLLRELPLNLKIHVFDYKIWFTKEHLAEIRQLLGLQIIRLRRRDILSATASYYLADATNVYAALNEEEVAKHAQIDIPIDKEKLLQYYQWMKEWDNECGELLDGIPHEEVFFEELFHNSELNREELFRVHGILKIPEDRTLVSLPKILDQKLRHPQTPIIEKTLKEII
jgi:LPS sulfotransferase NodH